MSDVTKESIVSHGDSILRFAVNTAETGLAPPKEITEAARQAARSIDDVAPGVIKDQLERLLLGKRADVGLAWLHEVGVLGRILPELEATVDFSQEAGRKHKDVWEHTKQVVRQAVLSAPVRWAALLHDVGKVPTRTFLPDGKVHFHGHAEVGARMFDRIAKRLPFERALKDKVRFLIYNHLRASQYLPSWTDSAVRRFAREIGEHLEDLLQLSCADCTSQRPGRRDALLRELDALFARIVSIRELDAKQPPLPTGLGTAISERFGIPPSKRIGELKEALENAIEEGKLEERRDADYYLDWLAANILG